MSNLSREEKLKCKGGGDITCGDPWHSAPAMHQPPPLTVEMHWLPPTEDASGSWTRHPWRRHERCNAACLEVKVDIEQAFLIAESGSIDPTPTLVFVPAREVDVRLFVETDTPPRP